MAIVEGPELPLDCTALAQLPMEVQQSRVGAQPAPSECAQTESSRQTALMLVTSYPEIMTCLAEL